MKETWSCTSSSQLGDKENFQTAIFVIASLYLLFNKEDLLISECLVSIYNVSPTFILEKLPLLQRTSQKTGT